MSLPGDDLVPAANVTMDREFTLAASPETIWPWFVQLGKNRAGWYLPRSIERFIPKRRRALRRIDPALQNHHVGDRIDDWGGRRAYFDLAISDAPNLLAYKSRRGRIDPSWTISLTAAGDHTVVHLRLRLAKVKRTWLANSVGDWIDAITVAGLAAGLSERLNARSAGPR